MSRLFNDKVKCLENANKTFRNTNVLHIIEWPKNHEFKYMKTDICTPSEAKDFLWPSKEERTRGYFF